MVRPHNTQTTNETAAQVASDQLTIFQFNIIFSSLGWNDVAAINQADEAVNGLYGYDSRFSATALRTA